MLLDSFEHAEADFAARLLIEARNEAETVIHATEKSLRAPDFAEIAKAELAAGRAEADRVGAGRPEDGAQLARPRGHPEVDAGAQRRDAASRRGDDEPLGPGGAVREERRSRSDELSICPKSLSSSTARPTVVEFEHGKLPYSQSRQARVVSRRRQALRRAARARLRRQLRLHDLPRHHPRGRAEPERDAGRRGRSPRHGLGPDAALAPRLPGGHHRRRRLRAADVHAQLRAGRRRHPARQVGQEGPKAQEVAP